MPAAMEHGNDGSSSRGLPSVSRIFSRRKKIADLSNLRDCHCCGKRSDGLEVFDSHWRIVLLCEVCLRAVRGAEACSYCFENFSLEEQQSAVVCQDCSCRVHPRCLPIQRGYLVRSDVLHDFLCIDCCPFLRNPSKIQNLPPAGVVSAEDGADAVENCGEHDKPLMGSSLAEFPCRKMSDSGKDDGEEMGGREREVVIHSDNLSRTEGSSVGASRSPKNCGSRLPDRFSKTYFKRSPGLRKEKS